MNHRIVGRRPFPYDIGYSGPLRMTRYFEGWYHRHLTPDGSGSLAVIVGVALSPEPHAFIQLMAGPEHKVLKVSYPLESFRARRDRHEVELEGNRFSADGMTLDIDRDGERVSGSVSYSDRAEYPVSFFSPGIMGPFSWAPAMECIHGVISMDHTVAGKITWNDKVFDLDGGRGYVEKDRGRSMPREWIWCHANCFDNAGDTLMLSVARIPWIGMSFTGHLGFLRYRSELWKIGTYAGTRIQGSVDGEVLDITIRDRDRSLGMRIEGLGHGGGLDAPVRGSMNREIFESSDSTVTTVLHVRGSKVWEGVSRGTALETTGDFRSLL